MISRVEIAQLTSSELGLRTWELVESRPYNSGGGGIKTNCPHSTPFASAIIRLLLNTNSQQFLVTIRD